jgi:hypothetical protein
MEGFTSGKALPDPARKPTAPGTVFPGGRKGGRKAIRPIRAWEQLRWWWSKDKKRMGIGRVNHRDPPQRETESSCTECLHTSTSFEALISIMVGCSPVGMRNRRKAAATCEKLPSVLSRTQLEVLVGEAAHQRRTVQVLEPRYRLGVVLVSLMSSAPWGGSAGRFQSG